MIIAALIIGIILGIVSLPFTVKARTCPVCGYRITYAFYWRSRGCWACKTRYRIIKGELVKIEKQS